MQVECNKSSLFLVFFWEMNRRKENTEREGEECRCRYGVQMQVCV